MTGEAAGTWFSGKSAIVTGAARGIGRATAELLSTLGASVVALDRDEDALHANLGTDGCAHWVVDMADDAVEEAAEEIWQRHGPIQLLVNNVGIDSSERFFDLNRSEFDRVFSTNLRGPWFFTRQIARRMRDAQRGGAIVFVSSLHDTFICTRPHYSASKAAVAMLVKELANDLAPSGIRVNAVSPGSIRTERLSDNGRARAEWHRRVVPLARAGEPVEVARMIAVLLSDEWSGYVTGTNVPVDGGLGLHSWFHDHEHGNTSSTLGRLRSRWTR
jgi:NAD(P)-dependent dehydrogenase (short-subunit alcohol dehydrogenase family)